MLVDDDQTIQSRASYLYSGEMSITCRALQMPAAARTKLRHACLQASGCTLRIVINVSAPFVYNGVASNTSYEPTFNDYLNAQLSEDLNCTFVTVTTFSQTETFQAVSNGSVDFVLTNSGTHACLAVCITSSPCHLRCIHISTNRPVHAGCKSLSSCCFFQVMGLLALCLDPSKSMSQLEFCEQCCC